MEKKKSKPLTPFEIQDDNDFRVALNGAIMEVMPDGFALTMHSRVSALTHHERLFLAVDIFDMETFNDGIEHFFFYDCGDLYEYVIEGLNAIGMQEFALQLQEYVEKIFGAELPLETAARQEIILAREAALEDDDEDAFSRYYDTSVKLSECLVEWARANRGHFWCGVFQPEHA